MAACLCIIAICSSVFAEGYGEEWTSWGYDLKNTRSTPSVGPQTNKLKWEYNIGRCGKLTSPLLVSGDTGYITDDLGRIYAIDLTNQKRTKWVYQLSEQYYYNRPSPFIDGDMIYVAGDKKIYAISTESGLPQKTYKVASGVAGFTLYNNEIYAIDEGNNLVAIEKDSGGIKWQIQLIDTYSMPCYPAIDSNLNAIYIGGDRYLCAVDLVSGISRWCYEFPKNEQPPENSNSGDCYYSSSAPAISEDGVIYLSHCENLYAIHPDGELKWEFMSTEMIRSSIAIFGDTLYFGDLSGMFYALDRNDASLRWYYQSQDMISSPPVVGKDGTCYFKSGDSNIYALSSDGNLKWVFATQKPWEISSELSLANGELHAAVSNNILTFGKPTDH